jgi:hypothetical protein
MYRDREPSAAIDGVDPGASHCASDGVYARVDIGRSSRARSNGRGF